MSHLHTRLNLTTAASRSYLAGSLSQLQIRSSCKPWCRPVYMAHWWNNSRWMPSEDDFKLKNVQHLFSMCMLMYNMGCSSQPQASSVSVLFIYLRLHLWAPSRPEVGAFEEKTTYSDRLLSTVGWNLLWLWSQPQPPPGYCPSPASASRQKAYNRSFVSVN